jgi:hypothetical protein
VQTEPRRIMSPLTLSKKPKHKPKKSSAQSSAAASTKMHSTNGIHVKPKKSSAVKNKNKGFSETKKRKRSQESSNINSSVANSKQSSFTKQKNNSNSREYRLGGGLDVLVGPLSSSSKNVPAKHVFVKKKQQVKHPAPRNQAQQAIHVQPRNRSDRFFSTQNGNSMNQTVPWLAPEYLPDTGTSSHYEARSTQKPKLPTDSIPDFLLCLLDDEIIAMANYLRLSRQEQDARQFVIDELNTIAKSMDNRHTRFASNGAVPIHDVPVGIQVYGSFASGGVCSFTSDVDMA